MRRLAFALALSLAAPLATAPRAQVREGALPRPSPNAALAQTVGVTDVTVTYGRPAARGRVVFGAAGSGALVPYGEVWRTGANEATTITFSTDVTVEGRPLAAGTYGLFTVPGAEAWEVVFNRVPNQWGAYAYDAGQDALRVTVRPEAVGAEELFTITADAVSESEATLALRWAGVRVPVRVGVDAAAAVRARAEAEVAQATDFRVPLRYASWSAQTGQLVPEANGWADRAVALEANYQTLAAQARLRAAAGRYAEAAQAGERALAMGRGMAEAPRGLAELEAELAGWRER